MAFICCCETSVALLTALPPWLFEGAFSIDADTRGNDCIPDQSFPYPDNKAESCISLVCGLRPA